MLRSLKDLERYTVRATDGDIGNVVDFLLDDERWIVRYLVVQTGGPLFLDGRQVLVSPISFRQAEWSTQRFHLAMSMDMVRKSPSIDVDKPVSRQHERDFYRYYGYPHYWDYTGVWGSGSHPGLLAAGTWADMPVPPPHLPNDVHLRSAKEVRGYHIQGTDEAIGHVADFLVDDETWEVRYLVVDTSNWWFGKKVLVAPQWSNRISWEESNVYVGLSREAIKSSPAWDPNAAVNREYEERLYDYYGRPVYWRRIDRSAPKAGLPRAESQQG